LDGRGQQACTLGYGGRLNPAGDAELAQDAGDVDAGGFGADLQLSADLRVGQAGGKQAQHSQLAWSQLVWREVVCCGRALEDASSRGFERDSGPFSERFDPGPEGRAADARAGCPVPTPARCR
jgi:hypothetical protein